MNVIFLDIDGVLNCQLHYQSLQYKDYREAKKTLRKAVKANAIEDREYYSSQICKDRLGWLNKLCEDINAEVVISSTWRSHGLDFMQKTLAQNGATFDVIDVTPWLRHEGCLRGNEIYQWIQENSVKRYGIPSHDFNTYAIIDDDSDMLLWQAKHFFQTDNYSGLTPTICYKINRFFGGKMFPAIDI